MLYGFLVFIKGIPSSFCIIHITIYTYIQKEKKTAIVLQLTCRIILISLHDSICNKQTMRENSPYLSHFEIMFQLIQRVQPNKRHQRELARWWFLSNHEELWDRLIGTKGLVQLMRTHIYIITELASKICITCSQTCLQYKLLQISHKLFQVSQWALYSISTGFL